MVVILWNQIGRFPVGFREIQSLREVDETDHYVQSLEKLTPYLGDVFKELTEVKEGNKSP